MNVKCKKLISFVLVVFVLLIAVQTRILAQGGPSFTVTFNPPGSANVGTTVTIHVEVSCNPNCGAARITPSCGGVDQVENTSGRFDSHWTTTGCQSGNPNVLVCTKSAADEQWAQGNCQPFGYTLTGSINIPSGTFGADTGNLQPNQCTTMHWGISGADIVKVEGNQVASSGSQQICPAHNKQYNLEASNSAGTLYLNFMVTVTDVPQPQLQPTAIPQPTNPQPNSGDDWGIDRNGKPFNRTVPFVSGIPSLSQARQGDGGVAVSIYCAAMGKDSTRISHAEEGTPNAAYTWKCEPDLPLGDFNRVCYEVWGNYYHSIQTQGPNSLGTWKCVQGGSQPVSPTQRPLPSNCSGVLPSRLVVGQNATVTHDGDSLSLRRGDGIDQPKITTLNEGTVGVVIGGPRCTNGYNWWQIQVGNEVGWSAEADNISYWLQPGGQSIQPTVVPPTPVPQPTVVTAQQQGQANDPCATNAYADMGITLASWHEGPKPVNVAQEDGGWQCGVYVRAYLLSHYGFDMQNYNGKSCTSSPVRLWLDSARNCGLEVDQELSTVQPGDIVLWPGNCGIAGEDGHVAVVLVPPSVTGGGMVEVTDANHSGDRQKYEKWKWPLASCVYFIHTSLVFSPSSGGQGIASGNIAASAINIACIYCSTHNDWVEFRFPTGRFDPDSIRVYLTYVGTDSPIWTETTVFRSSEGGYDTFRFVLDSGTLSSVATGHHLTLAQLRTISAWFAHYVVTK